MADLVQSTRDRGLTALFEGFFGAAWFGWAQATAPAGAVAALVAAAVGDVAPGTVTGVGAGVLLLAFGAAALVRTV
jgi:hypothetical protein